MNNDNDNDMIACAQIVRAAVNNETEVTISRRFVISSIHPAVKSYFEISFGDIFNRTQWKWDCAQAETLAWVQEKALALIAAQGDERNRELQRLQDSAAKLGLQLVEVQS